MGGCTAWPDDPVSSSRATIPGTSAPPTTVADPAALCNGYLVLLRTGDDVPLREALEDPDLVEALDVMLSSEGEFAAIASAALEVEEAVVSRCAERYSVGLEPAPDDAAALTVFMEALVGGDRSAAETVAWDNVVAQLEPWSPFGDDDAPSYRIEGSTAIARLDPAITLSCTATDGVVVSCTYGE